MARLKLPYAGGVRVTPAGRSDTVYRLTISAQLFVRARAKKGIFAKWAAAWNASLPFNFSKTMTKMWLKWPVVGLSLLCLGGCFSFGNKKAQPAVENKKTIEPEKTEGWEVAFTIEYKGDKEEVTRIELAGVGEAQIDWGDSTVRDTLSLDPRQTRTMEEDREIKDRKVVEHVYEAPGRYRVRMVGKTGGSLIWLKCAQDWIKENIYLTTLDVSRCPELEFLNCSNNRIARLKFGGLTELNELYCVNNELTELDVTQNKKLEGLICFGNRLEELNVSQNSRLKKLDCDKNRLARLEVDNNTELIQLSCHSNRIERLELGSCTLLEELDCSNNRLTELDISRNTELWHLKCNKNRLTEVNVEMCPNLSSLECAKNQLTTLNCNENTRLSSLTCSDNRLTRLEVDFCRGLRWLYCNGNRLTELNLKRCWEIYGLECQDNLLTELKFENFNDLRTLLCQRNRLTKLEVRGSNRLEELDCSDNELTELDATGCNGLTQVYCMGNRFSTEAVNCLYGTLPERSKEEPGGIRLDENDEPVGNTAILAAKNWKLGVVLVKAEEEEE